MSEYEKLVQRIAVLEKRLEGMMRPGKVAEVDTSTGTVRLNFGTDDKPVLSAKIPYSQQAGAIKLHAPPSVGQQMISMAPSGNQKQATAFPDTFGGDNSSPGGGADNAMTFGDISIGMSGSALTINVGGTIFELSAAGLMQTGGAIKHDGVTIDKTHVHPQNNGNTYGGGTDTSTPK